MLFKALNKIQTQSICVPLKWQQIVHFMSGAETLFSRNPDFMLIIYILSWMTCWLQSSIHFYETFFYILSVMVMEWRNHYFPKVKRFSDGKPECESLHEPLTLTDWLVSDRSGAPQGPITVQLLFSISGRIPDSAHVAKTSCSGKLHN